MTFERYSDRYFLDVVQLVQNFHSEAVGEYDNLFDPEALIETIKANKDSSTAFLLIEDEKCQGILFGVSFKAPINDNLVFQEVIWYVNEPFRKHGVKLLKESQKMLKSQGISIMIMAVLENSKTEKLKRFYEALGYKKMETHYVRAI